nr:OpcA/G6PD domain-containing protein [Arthrobacter wenxiniae]
MGAPTTMTEDPRGTGIRRVILEREGGNVELHRPGAIEAEMSQPGQPVQQISLPRRTLQDCLAEELRRLDPDEVFGEGCPAPVDR